MTPFVIDLWTDGSGTSAGNPGGWAYVIDAANGELERCESGFVSDSTNNRAEMTALLMGLRALKAPAFVLVHADSAILMNPWVNNRFPRWIEKDWRGIQNVDLWKALLTAAEPHTLTWAKVKSHSNVALNEECDKLAGLARGTAIRLSSSLRQQRLTQAAEDESSPKNRPKESSMSTATMSTAEIKGAMMSGVEIALRAELQIVEEALATGQFPVDIPRPRSTSTGHLGDANHAVARRQYLAGEIAKRAKATETAVSEGPPSSGPFHTSWDRRG